MRRGEREKEEEKERRQSERGRRHGDGNGNKGGLPAAGIVGRRERSSVAVGMGLLATSIYRRKCALCGETVFGKRPRSVACARRRNKIEGRRENGESNEVIGLTVIAVLSKRRGE